MDIKINLKETLFAIAKSYTKDEGILTEIDAALNNHLPDDIDANESDLDKFEKAIGFIAAIEDEDAINYSKLLLELREINSDASFEIMKTMDADEILYFVTRHRMSAGNSILIDVPNMVDMDKIKEFVCTEIYPSTSDQESYIHE